MLMSSEESRWVYKMQVLAGARHGDVKETEFFLKLVDATISFDVDANGKATALTLHQNGQHLKGARIK